MSQTATEHDTDRPAQLALRLFPRINRWAQSRIERRELGGDLSLRQLSALYIIRHESATLGQVARRLMVTPAVVTGLIDRLEKRGYVQRVNQPGDRRRIHLALTEEGRARSIEVENFLISDIATQVRKLSAHEMEALERGLEILDRIVGELENEHAIQRPFAHRK
ncbi:MAG: MarR family winged helix-turn-helix transcriptional regulator [Thermomicrobiales bacterium]